jgi:hypothetical protein
MVRAAAVWTAAARARDVAAGSAMAHSTAAVGADSCFPDATAIAVLASSVEA